ncbi:hypothetical protein [Umezakia ovalisporum]|uniref:MotA/TolQ/ExbB proton channel domain-containing protein n=1 Tax=Umezakia ovalisporum FSS-62 TaxID=2971776 RepID=A0AA43KFZ7_9CYAN|nr:hypothetical protein [Umezakia ovalisporum]MDH6065126.1 hypothetical protein [Umezakia ovalisporum FSS-62]
MKRKLRFLYEPSSSIDINLKENEEIIEYLKENKPSDETSKVLSPTLRNSDDKVSRWLEKHLVRIRENNDGNFHAQVEGGRFVLLQYPTVFTRSIPSSFWRFVPTILIAIGVLGTFYGIQEGLSKIDISNIEQNSSNLLEASVQLLRGMKTAFSTSLMGLGSSSIFTIVLAIAEERKRQRIKEVRHELDKIAFVQSPARVLSRLKFDAIAGAAKSLEETAGIITTSFTKLIEAQRQLSPDAIGRAIGQEMSPIFEGIKKELSLLKDIKHDQGGEILKNLIREQREQLIEPLIAELNRSAKLTQEASQAVHELKKELGGISQSLSQSVNTIQRFQEDTLVKLQDFAGNLQFILNEFRSDTQGVMERVSTEIQSAVSASVQAIDAQKIAFESSASQAANTFRGIREDLQAALHTQAEIERQMLQEFQDRTVAIITTQTESITTVGNEASRLMDAARENLISTLSNIDTMLQNTRITVQEELQQFRLNYQEALQNFFTSQHELLEETLGEQRQGLAQVVNDLQTAFNDEYERRLRLSAGIEETMTRIQETVRIMNNFANAVGLHSGERLEQIIEISRLLGSEATRIEKVYAGMIEQLNQALAMSNQHLVTYLEQASASERVFFTQADEATARISHQLLQAANYLVAAEANRRDQNNHNS